MPRTVNLFQTGLFWNGCHCLFVERAPMAREVELLVESDILTAEDFARTKSLFVR